MALIRGAPSPLLRVGLLIGSGVLLIGAALWAGSVGRWVSRPETRSTPRLPTYDLPTITPPTVRNVDPPAARPSGGEFDASVILLVLGGILLVAIVLMGVSMISNRSGKDIPRRSRPSPPSEWQPTPVAPDPDRPFDPRQAADYVIACWGQLEQHAVAKGRPRRPEQTPTEFLEVLQQTFPLPQRAAADLLGLYQRARFDHVRLTPDTAVRARTDVDLLLAALEHIGAAR